MSNRTTPQQELFAKQELSWNMLPDQVQASIVELISVLLDQSLDRLEADGQQFNVLEVNDERQSK